MVLFTLSGQFLCWFTLRLSFEAVQRSFLPSFHLYLLFPTVGLTFNFSSLLIIPQNPIEGAHGKFKLQKMPNSGPTLPRSRLPVQTDFSSPYRKPRTFSPNLSHSIHHMVACCYDNEGLSWVVLSFWWLPKGEIILLKICLSFYAKHGRYIAWKAIFFKSWSYRYTHLNSCMHASLLLHPKVFATVVSKSHICIMTVQQKFRSRSKGAQKEAG